MTKNELMTIEQGTFKYNFKPAVIDINDYDKLVETAEMVAKHYDSLVLTNADLNEINETHRELNSFIKGLDEDRLKVKREYNKPLKEFEDKIKHVTGLLNKPLQDIKNARDEILIKQEETRREALDDYLERQLKDSKVRIEDIEIPNQWTNKGNWTEKLNPRKKLTDEIKREIERLEEENKRKLAERETLETFLDSKDMAHDGWVSQLEYRDALDIIKEIQRAEEEKKQREQIEKEHKLQADIDNESVNPTAEEAEILNIEDEQVTENINRDFFEVEQTITEKIMVTGTVEQLNKLNKFMVENGIKVEPIINEDDLVTDDLPF